jgi:hypothetical protein
MRKPIDLFLRMNLDLSELVGQSLTMVQREGNTWSFHLSGGDTIFTEEPWRLMTPHGTRISSEDDRVSFGETEMVDAGDQLIAELQGEAVENARYDGSGDLSLVFSGDRTLQFLQLSSGYESWRLHLKDAEFICLGGGGLAEFPRSHAL